MRKEYDVARKHIPREAIKKTPLSEILLVNQRGEVMEASFSTPYFLRGGSWITPAASCGGNIGTTRRWALEKRYCIEGIIDAKSLAHGEMIRLSNGARGFTAATIDLECQSQSVEGVLASSHANDSIDV